MYKYIDEGKKHLHTFDKKPLLGTSSVVGVISKPLTWWASGLACEKLGWINSKEKVDGKYTTIPQETREMAVLPHLESIKGMSEAEFIALLDEAYKAHSVKLSDSADAGTDLHAECEAYVKGKIGVEALRDYDPKILPFVFWCDENVEEFLWSEAHCYSTTMWVGGISDCGAKLKNGKNVIIDFKSSKEAYNSQFIQIAGYSLQIEENGIFTKDGELVKTFDKPFDEYIVFPFGAGKVEAQVRYNTEELKNGFKAALTLYKIENQ